VTPHPEDIRTIRLAPGRSLRVRDAAGCIVTCCAGAVWITQERDARDIFLATGQSFTFDRPGLALIHAEEGMKDEWLNDTGITVISLPMKLLQPGRKQI
jgi:ferric-dicitrate binding protein FerR (iron transport regulator)